MKYNVSRLFPSNISLYLPSCAKVANEQVLIHAGAGGVGHVAIQLAKLKGATVSTTVSSEEKANFVKELGADHVILISGLNLLIYLK